MAKKTNRSSSGVQPNYSKFDKGDAPATLTDHPFYGLTLDEEQQIFRDAIWDQDVDIVFCNAKAGTGKNTISIATGLLLVSYNIFDELVYVTAGGVHEYKQGLLPGSLEDKSRYLMAPLYQAVVRLGYNPEQIIKSEQNMLAEKNGSAMISCMTDSYARGINIGDSDHRVICIIDEAQNMTEIVLRTILTRIGVGSKAVVIGSSKQIDLKYKQDSAFVPFINHFCEKEKCKVCTLSKGYRSWIADWADEL